MSQVSTPLSRKIVFGFVVCLVFYFAFLHATFAQAQQDTCAVMESYEKTDFLLSGEDVPLAFDPCLRAPHEGRFAVLLPTAGQAMDAPMRWGFLAADGTLAVEPRFDHVSDFHQGLAAAQEHGKWGYIDRQGAWVIAPRFDSAADFVQIGLAVVTEHGQRILIGRDGYTVGQAFAANLASVELADGTPARARLTEQPYYLSLQGVRRALPSNMQPMSNFGEQGLMLAKNDAGRYGIVSADWQWLVKPIYERIDTLGRDSGVVAGIGEDDVSIITPDGRAKIPAIADGSRVLAMGQQFTVIESGDGKGVDLLDVSGHLTAHFPPGEMSSLSVVGTVVIHQNGHRLVAYIPGRSKPVMLNAKVTNAVSIAPFVALMDADDNLVGIITPTGQVLSMTGPSAWMRGIKRAEIMHGRVWLYGDNNRQHNIIDKNGQALLSESVRRRLDQYQLNALPLAPVMAYPVQPMAMVLQNYCQCEGQQGSGILLSNGSIVLNPEWLETTLAEDENNLSAMPLTQWRFRIKTKNAWGLIDGTGRVLLPTKYENIGNFQYDHALVFRDGVLSVVGRDGAHYALPDVFEAELISPNLVRYRETAAESARWGLYNFKTQRIVLAPTLLDVLPYTKGSAAASMADGQWGVIDEIGKWIIAPQFSNVKRINDALWRVEQTAPAAPAIDIATAKSDIQAAVFHASGRVIIGFHSGLEVGVDDGLISVSAENQTQWYLTLEGQIIAGDSPSSMAKYGSWILVAPKPTEGYLDASATWRIAPEVATGSIFQASQTSHPLAVRNLSNASNVIKNDGKTTVSLPKGRWFWPADSEDIIRRSFDKQGYMQTYFANLDGQIVLTVPGNAGSFSGGRASLHSGDKEVRLIDRSGKPVSENVFDDLGMLHGGLAYASTERKYGFVNSDGQYLIAPLYDSVSNFDTSTPSAMVAAARLGDESLLLDQAGKPLAHIINQCGVRTLFSADQGRLWPLPSVPTCNPPELVLQKLAAAFSSKDIHAISSLIIDGWSGLRFCEKWSDESWQAAAAALRNAKLESSTKDKVFYTVVSHRENAELDTSKSIFFEETNDGEWKLDLNSFLGPFPHL